MKNKKNICLIILIIIFIVILSFLLSVIKDVFGKKAGENITISVSEGESFSSVLDKMENEKIIKHKLLFKQYAIGKGADINLKAGEHKMYKNMGYKRAAMELMAYGDGQNTIMLTIPEGYEIKEIAEIVEKTFNIPQDRFKKASEEKSDFPFLENLKGRENILEGYLFPDTYEFYKDATPEEIIKKMLEGFSNNFTEVFYKRAKELNMSVDEVVILASIIEREAGTIEEMGKVSSVFHNRLKINMPLQSCATVQYILKERKEVLSIKDTKIDSPYNTYINPGLPIGPISNPGKAAIKAALYPEDTDYYYFKVNEEGITLFSKTLSEHNAK